MNYNKCMTTYHIEKEYKMMIDEALYYVMTQSIPCDRLVTQTNYYYQAKANMGMRIRMIDDNYFFTLKHFIKGQVREYEFPIKENDISDPSIRALLKELNIEDPFYLGEMTTIRSSCSFAKGELCLDRSLYLGIEDYEIEYELNDPTDDDFTAFASLLAEFGLNYCQSPYSKYTRFKNRLEEIK